MTRAAGTKAANVVMKCITAATVVLAVYLVWALRSLILPASVGGLMAYICRPFVVRLERCRIPRRLAVVLLLFMFALVALVSVNRLRAVIPSETGALELRVRALYELNHRYQALMGLDPSWTRGNRLYRLAHRDLDPLVDRANGLLALTPDERGQFIAASGGSDRLLEYDRANVDALQTGARRTARAEPATRAVAEQPSMPAPTSAAKPPPAALGDFLSTWVIAPPIFLFFLWDSGDIKRGLLRAVPNQLFEPALAVLADLDEALGDYVRGIFLECCLLALTVIVFVTIVGVPIKWAIPIGIFTGASNVVPYMGIGAAMLGGLGYALLAEDLSPLLPLVNAETFPIWVVVAVALAGMVDNFVYEPIVLGGAVNLHPLVVLIGVVGGATLFGPVGVFLAIPTITVVKVFVASTARHLTAYGLI